MQTSLKEEMKYLMRKLSEKSDSILFARLADAYLQADQVDDAIELCEFGVKKHPTYVTGHFILGKCYLKKKMLDQAEKEFKRAIMYDPKYIAAHREYGELMAQIGWHTTCEMTYEEILRLDPLSEKAKKRLADIKRLFFPQKEQAKKEADNLSFKDENDQFISAKQTARDEIDYPQTAHENLNLGTDVQGAPAETDVSELRDEDDASMDLLEDIFRDTTIPDLDIGEVAPPEIKAERESEKSYEQPIKKTFPLNDLNETVDYELPITETAHMPVEEKRSFASDFDSEKTGKKTTPESPSPDDFLAQHFESPPQSAEKKPMPSANSDSFSNIDPFFSSQPSTQDQLSLKERETFNDPFFGFEQEKSSVLDDFEKIEPAAELEIEPADKQVPQYFPAEPKSIFSEKEEDQSPIVESEEDIQDKKKEKIVTPTLGEIYAAQHQYSKAISVYATLLKKDPDNSTYLQKIEYFQKKLEEFGDS